MPSRFPARVKDPRPRCIHHRRAKARSPSIGAVHEIPHIGDNVSREYAHFSGNSKARRSNNFGPSRQSTINHRTTRHDLPDRLRGRFRGGNADIAAFILRQLPATGIIWLVHGLISPFFTRRKLRKTRSAFAHAPFPVDRPAGCAMDSYLTILLEIGGGIAR